MTTLRPRLRQIDNMSAKSVSSSLSRLLKCPSCREILQQPQMLQCGHSICEPCMQHIGSRIICSECGEMTEKDMIRQKLCLHHSIERKKTPKTPASSKGLTFPCSKCGDEYGKYESIQCQDCGNQLFCIDCNAKVCKACQPPSSHTVQTHRETRGSTHRTIKVADMIKERRKSFTHWRHEQYGKQLNTLTRNSTKLLAKERRSNELLNDIVRTSRKVFGVGSEIATYMTNVDTNLVNFEKDDRNFLNNNYERHMFPPFTNYDAKLTFLLTRQQNIIGSLEAAKQELDVMLNSPHCK